jgi:hypothetical protein
MTMKRRLGLILVLVSGGLSVLWGCSLGWKAYGGPLDFQAVYYGTRTLIEHHNPYSVGELNDVFSAETNTSASITPKQRYDITLFVNTPATLLLLAPFALLPLAAGQVLWMFFTTGSLILAAYLMWTVGADHAPILTGCLIGFLLLNCQVIFAAGNTAAIVVGLTVAAVWCFVKERFAWAGVVCLAISLAMKPHDAGLVWLFLLLAGGTFRKRALQTAILAALLIVPAVLWVSHVVPNWMHDWQSNMATISAPGALNDPRPAIVKGVSAGNVISLQAVFSIFNGDPRFYNLASYLVCGAVLIVWAFLTFRSRTSSQRIWFALAVGVPFTILVTYHRVYDAKLLLLTVPACAMLCEEGGAIGTIAVALSSMGIFLNADIPLAVLGAITEKLQLSTATLTGKILTVLVARPNQEVLLAMGIFYLWVYLRKTVDAGENSEAEIPQHKLGDLAAL